MDFRGWGGYEVRGFNLKIVTADKKTPDCLY
jgi:hypothetical protein